jgi:CCDC81 eukaryotic HU domain 1
MHVVLEALSNYIREKLLDGKGVTVKGLGAFCFEVNSETVKPAQYYSFDTRKDLDYHREERKHVHKIRPCFIVDSSFKYSLANFAEKEEISGIS